MLQHKSLSEMMHVWQIKKVLGSAKDSNLQIKAHISAESMGLELSYRLSCHLGSLIAQVTEAESGSKHMYVCTLRFRKGALRYHFCCLRRAAGMLLTTVEHSVQLYSLRAALILGQMLMRLQLCFFLFVNAGCHARLEVFGCYLLLIF